MQPNADGLPPLTSLPFGREAVRTLVKDVIGCNCSEEIFEHIERDVFARFPEPVSSQSVQIAVGGRLLIALVPMSALSKIEEEVEVLLALGKAARDARGLNRFRLLIVGDLQPSVLVGLEAKARQMDEKLHVHQFEAGRLAALLGPPKG